MFSWITTRNMRTRKKINPEKETDLELWSFDCRLTAQSCLHANRILYERNHASCKNINDTCTLWNMSDNPRSYNLSLSEWIIRMRRWGRSGKWPKLWQRYHGPCTKTAWKLASQVHLCTISLVAMVPLGSISTHTRLTRQRISNSRAIHFRVLLQIRQSKSRAIILSFATRKI